VDGYGAFERISEAYTVNRLHINQRNLRHKKWSRCGILVPYRDYLNTYREPKFSATECGYASKEVIMCYALPLMCSQKRGSKHVKLSALFGLGIFSASQFSHKMRHYAKVEGLSKIENNVVS